MCTFVTIASNLLGVNTLFALYISVRLAITVFSLLTVNYHQKVSPRI